MKTKENTGLIGYQNKCQICSHKKLDTVMSLGHQPIVQAYLNEEGLEKPEVTYPLNLCRCRECGLLQLDYIINPTEVFPKDYPYLTGMTNMLIRNFRSLANELITTYKLTSKDLVVDIGSNDGTLLQGFKEKNIRVFGVEPTDAARIAVKAGVPTIQKFFNVEVARSIVKKHGKAKIVTATNMFAHINDPLGFLSGVKELLTPDGIFVSESQYLMDILEKHEFDTIYHEHLRFYSLKPLQKLFSLAGFSMVDAERIEAAGGSIRVYAAIKNNKQKSSSRVTSLLKAEEKAGLYKESTYHKFAERVHAAKRDLLALLIRSKKNNGRIVGIGSPARANTLLGFTHIDPTYLDYCVERAGSLKIGLYTPGTHIRVQEEKKLFEDQPEYALLLSWHIGVELAKKLRELGYRGKFIMPLPRPRILNI